MSEIFIKLLNMSISAGWLVLCVVILRLLLNRSPKWIACVLWSMVALRLLCPFSLESVLSLVPSAETVPEEIIYSESPEIESGIPIINSTVNPIISDSLGPSPKAEVNPVEIITGVASVIWIVGVAAMAVYATVSYIRIRKRVSEAVREGDGVWICDRIDTPFILGLFAPRIILPSDLKGEDREYVISHERAHLSRMDHIWKPLGYALLTVYWFNPLIWIGYILLCRDIEAACDEKVIRKLGEEAKKPYAEALINCSVPKRMISACPLAFGESGVKERVKNVLNYKKPAFWIIIVAIVACILVAVCFLTNPKEKDEKPTDKDGNVVVDADDDKNYPAEPEEGLLTWLIYDFNNKETQYTSKDSGKKVYVKNYFGTYNGAAVVTVERSDKNYSDPKADETVAGCTFNYADKNPIVVYTERDFYSLTEAYENGILTAEDIKGISKISPRIYNDTEYALPIDFVPCDPPKDDVLNRVVKDYCVSRSKNPDDIEKMEGVFYVERYYGTYDGAVAVIITGTHRDYADVCLEQMVAGCLFTYSNYNPMVIWKNGSFYSLQEAYDGGILSKEQIKEMRKTYPITYENMEFKYPNTKDEETNKSFPELPAEGLLVQIAKDFCEYHVEKYNFDPEIHGGFYVSEYYGMYNNSVSVLMKGTGVSYSTVITTETVAGYTFTYPCSNTMWVWNNGSFYSLQEAYDKGLLTKEDIAEIFAVIPIEYDVMEYGYPN